MKTYSFENEQDWLDARKGRVTGTRLKDLIVKRGTGKKIGFYEIIAERIALPADGENVMDRGHRLEEEAIALFTKKTGKEVDTTLVLWCREDDENIAISPDGFIGTKEAIEVKCLSSARHIEAFLTKEVPSEYREQVFQYFIVNDDLETLYFTFYDPRMPVDFFYLTVKRDDVKLPIQEYLKLEKEVLAEIDAIERQLTF